MPRAGGITLSASRLLRHRVAGTWATFVKTPAHPPFSPDEWAKNNEG